MHSISLPWSESQWQKDLSEAIKDPKELLRLLELDLDLDSDTIAAAKEFQLRTPRGFVARMRKQDINDPLLKQVLPLKQERLTVAGYSADPLGETTVNHLPGLLHKYTNRVLLTVSGACAINCRYCFRRHFDYAKNNPGKMGWQPVWDYIANKAEINEFIFSGADPFVLNDSYLLQLIEKITPIPHVKRLRIHTRLPIVLPERITHGLLNALKTRLQTIIVVHANHPNELDANVAAAMNALSKAGAVLFNQAVLLKDINDSALILRDLSEKLFAMGVLPYYLHLLDKVKGAAHFAVSKKRAKLIMRELMGYLPGYLAPRLVEEKAGAISKVLVAY
jgi:EF-P beta-lysylation protein EpmB